MRFKNTSAQGDEDVNRCHFYGKQDASMCTTLTTAERCLGQALPDTL